MAVEAKKVGLYGIVGFLGAVLIIASILVSGLRLPTFIPKTGTLMVKLTDAPVQLDQLNVTIDNVSVHNVEEDRWIDLEFLDPTWENVTVDLLKLQNVTTDLSITSIPAGNYTMIKLHIAKASALFHGEDKTVELNVPSKTIKVIIRFEIENGELRIILIDMGVDLFAVSQSGNLRPVVKAIVIS